MFRPIVSSKLHRFGVTFIDPVPLLDSGLSYGTEEQYLLPSYI